MVFNGCSAIQFVFTGEQGLLKVVIEHLRKIPLKEQRGPQERLHLKSLRSSVDAEDSFQDFTFFQSFLSPVQKWVDKKLNDYHLHFSEVCFANSWFAHVLHNMHELWKGSPLLFHSHLFYSIGFVLYK
jgi:hypothetical protein